MSPHLRSKCLSAGALFLLLTSCGKDAIDPSSAGADRTSLPLQAIVSFSASPGGPTAYVSLARGAVQHGATLAIVAPASGSPVTATLVDGGTDPVPVAAAVGDSLHIVATDSAGATYAAVEVVRARRPRVVRTVPAAHRTDVPLNIRIKVVFSEPVTLPSAAGGVQLYAGESPIAGTTSLVAGSPTAIEFVPDTKLAPNTDHVLNIDATVTDLGGSQIGQSQSVSFRTGGAEGGDPADPAGPADPDTLPPRGEPADPDPPGEPAPPPPDPGVPSGPALVALNVTINGASSTVVTGAQLHIDGGPGVPIDPGVHVFDVGPGYHGFTVSDLARNCMLDGPGPWAVEAQPGTTVALSMNIRCLAAGVRVNLETALPAPGMDGYMHFAFARLTRNGSVEEQRLVPLNGSVLLGYGLATGDYMLEVNGNGFLVGCIALAPQLVTIPQQGLVELSVHLDCSNATRNPRLPRP